MTSYTSINSWDLPFLSESTLWLAIHLLTTDTFLFSLDILHIPLLTIFLLHFSIFRRRLNIPVISHSFLAIIDIYIYIYIYSLISCNSYERTYYLPVSSYYAKYTSFSATFHYASKLLVIYKWQLNLYLFHPLGIYFTAAFTFVEHTVFSCHSQYFLAIGHTSFDLLLLLPPIIFFLSLSNFLHILQHFFYAKLFLSFNLS